MKNLQKFNLKELKANEIQDINGGGYPYTWTNVVNGFEIFTNAGDRAFDAVHGFFDALIGTDSHSV